MPPRAPVPDRVAGSARRTRRARLAALAVLALAVSAILTACSGSPSDAGDITLTVDGRSFTVHEPAGYDPATPTALVVGLHGYTSNAHEFDSYFDLTAASDARGFLLALPDGLTNPKGDHYWNAVDGGCCDFYSAGTDDSTWLSHVLTDLTDRYRVDRVVVIGHSNGGYMAQRLACDHADQVDVIALLAGPLSDDPAACRPSQPVTVLHIHGDADDTVPYDGEHPAASARATAEEWARLDGCAATPTTGAPLDLDSDLGGDETTVQRWDQGCRDGSQVQLWTIHGGGHVPAISPDFVPDVLGVALG